MHPWSFAVSEARTIDGDCAMPLTRCRKKIPDVEILGADAVAMNEHDSRAMPSFQIVEAHAVHGDEVSARRVIGLCRMLKVAYKGRGTSQNRRSGQHRLGARIGLWPVTSIDPMVRHPQNTSLLGGISSTMMQTHRSLPARSATV